MSNESRFFSYAGFAADVARMKLSPFAGAKQAAQARIAQRMGKMHGIPQKIGQLIGFARSTPTTTGSSGGPGAADPATSLPWNSLWDNSDCELSLSAVQGLLNSQWTDTTRWTIHPSHHAASIGQVHRATLPIGSEVAIKVQYPGLREQTRQDLQRLDWLARPLGNLKRGFNYEQYQRVIAEGIADELDYTRELENQKQAFANWKSHPGIVIPQPWDSYCNEQVLVATWESGQDLASVLAEWSATDRQAAAQLMLEFFLRSLLQFGALQTDWHPGNFRFRRQNGSVQVVCYDFGSVAIIDQEHQSAIRNLLAGPPGQSLDNLLALGFDGDFLEPIAERLDPVLNILTEPFRAAGPFDLEGWNMGPRVSATLGDDRWNLRFAGPPQFVFLMRAFHGLLKYLEFFQTPVDWQQTLRDVGGAPDLIPPRPSVTEAPPTPVETEIVADKTRLAARKLVIRIREQGRDKVRLSQPARNLPRLAELMPPNLLERIARRGLDLNEIIQQAEARNRAPGPVFELQDDDKSISVTLEN